MKKILIIAIVSIMLITVFAGCSSSSYPKKNINVIIQYSPGGPTDMSVRGMLDVASDELPSGVSFIPANKTGAGGIIGMTATANSKPDGYNIGVIAVDLLMHHYLGKTDLTLDEFTPLAAAMADPYGLVVKADAKYQTIDEFVKFAKENPGEINVGNSGAGGAPHLAALAFEKAFDIEFTHVSYDGSADCIAAIAGGHLDATFTQPSPAKSQMDAGELKMLGILNDKRLDSFPDVPTISETKKINNMRGWVVIVGPKGMKEEHVEYLRGLFTDTVKKDEFKEVIRSLGMEPVEIVGDDLTKMLQEDDTFYKDMCSNIDIK